MILASIKKLFAKDNKIKPQKQHVKTNLYKIKLRIKQRINNAKKSPKRLIKNLIPHAYSNRYLLKGTRLYKKTQGLKRMRSFTKEQEENLYSKLPAKITKMEKRLFHSKEFYLNRGRPLLSKLSPKYAKLYISNKRRNTFTSVSQSFTGKNFDRSFKVVFKASSGTQGFKGPKKKTVYARQDVIKSASAYINNNYFTATDLIFNTKAPRRGRKHLRTMFNNLIYIRSIKMTARRAHGYVRKPKQRRK